jgi:hypothetical protein
MPDKDKTDNQLHIGSIFSQQQKIGLVELSIGEFNFQMPVDKAREVANSLLEAAAASEMDEVVWTFFNEYLHTHDDILTARTLMQFRKIRNSLFEKYNKRLTPNQARLQREYLENLDK